MALFSNEQLAAFKENTRKKPKVYPKSFMPNKLTLDDLENDDTFSNTASRFLQSIGEDDDTVEALYEYMRDADYNLASAASRAFKELPNLSDQQKKDYAYLRRQFDKADTGSLKQWLRASTDIGIDLVTDPTVILSGLMVPFTGGASLASRTAAAEATKAGLKAVGRGLRPEKNLRQVLRERDFTDVRSGIKQLKKERQRVTQDFYRSEVKKNALIAGGEGAVFSGVSDYLRQEQDDIDGINLRYGLDLYEVGASTALGAVAGGVLGGGIAKISQKFNPEVRRTIDLFTDESILDESDRIYNLKRTADTVISNTIGKPTTRFIELSKKSKTLRGLLENFRYDTFKGQSERFLGFDEDKLKDFREGKIKPVRSYKQVNDQYAGKYNVALEDAIFPLLKKGKLSTEDNNLLDRMMRDKKLENLLSDPVQQQGEKASAYQKRLQEARAYGTRQGIKRYEKFGANVNHINAIRAARELSKEVLTDAASAGIYRRQLKAGPNAWFTRLWKHSVVKENRDELAQIMVDQKAITLPDDVTLQNLTGLEKERFQSLLKTEAAYTDLIENFEKYPLAEVKERLDTLGVAFKPDYQKLDNTPEALYQVLDTIQEEKNSIAFNIPETPEIRRQKFKVANDIIDDMLDKRNTVNDINSEMHGTKTPSSFSSRNLYRLDDRSIDKFIDHDFTSLMRDYVNGGARLVARKRMFGADSEEFSRRYLDVIRQELQDAGGTLTEKDRSELVKLYEYATGLADTTLENPYLQGSSDLTKLSQQMAHLPLATLSSLTEAFIPLTRVGTGTYIKGVGQALKSWSMGNYKNTVKILQDEHNLTKEEANREMHRVYLGLEQAIAQRIDSLAGEGIQNPLARKMQEKFFKVNLLSQWTRTVQLASFTMGKDLITRNLKTVAELQNQTLNKSQKRKLNAATQELFDLGIDIPRGLEWVRGGAKRYSGRVDNNTSLKEWDSFYERQVMEGAARFANEIILDPSKSAVTRPHIQQSALGSILFQFLGYPTAFTNTVLQNWYTQMKRQPTVGTARVGATALFMTGVATGLNAIRSDGESLEKEPDEIILDSVSRWGGTGFAEYILNAKANAEIGGGLFGTAVKSIGGPAVGDAVDAILYRKGIAEVAATNMPFYSALSRDVKNQYLKGPAREVDYNIAVGLGLRKPRQAPNIYTEDRKVYSEDAKVYRTPFFEGGRLQDYVETAPENPSSRIDRMTGLPYEIQAGDILQNRKSFRLGGFLKKGIQAYIGKTKEKVTAEQLQADPIYRELSPMLRNMETIDEEEVLQDINSGTAIEIKPEEQNFLTNAFIESSRVKEDLYSVVGEDVDSGLFGNRLGSYGPKELEAEVPQGALSKNKVRITNALKLNSVPEVPYLLVNNEEFLSKIKNKQRVLNLKKEIDKKIEYASNLDFSQSLFDKSVIVNEILVSGNKQLYNILRSEGYDAIEYAAPLPEPRLYKTATKPVKQEIPTVLTATGKDKLSRAFNEAQEEGSKAEYFEELEKLGLKDPRETDASYYIEADPEEVRPQQTSLIPSRVSTFEIEYPLPSQLASKEGRKNKQYIVFDNSQVLPFGRTEQPTKKEIEYINTLPVEERKQFIESNNVFNLNIPYIRNTLEEQGVFNLVSTSTKNSVGGVTSYKELTTDLIARLETQVSEEDLIKLNDFKSLLLLAEKERRKGNFIVPEPFYLRIEIKPGQDVVNFSSPLKLGEALADIKASEKTLFHPASNNVLSDSARKWRLLNIDAEDLKDNVELPTQFEKQEKMKVLSSLRKLRGTQYKGKYDKALDQQLEDTQASEYFNPTGATEPESLAEAATVKGLGTRKGSRGLSDEETPATSSFISKGVGIKAKEQKKVEKFLKENPEFLNKEVE